jgi:hypothetical protein
MIHIFRLLGSTPQYTNQVLSLSLHNGVTYGKLLSAIAEHAEYHDQLSLVVGNKVRHEMLWHFLTLFSFLRFQMFVVCFLFL